jgi:hypothetical protein
MLNGPGEGIIEHRIGPYFRLQMMFLGRLPKELCSGILSIAMQLKLAPECVV